MIKRIGLNVLWWIVMLPVVPLWLVWCLGSSIAVAMKFIATRSWTDPIRRAALAIEDRLEK